MCKNRHNRKSRSGAVAIGLAIASLSTLFNTALAARNFQLPELNTSPTGQARVSGAQVRQSRPEKGSSIAKTTLGLDVLYQEFQQHKTTARALAAAPFRSKQTMVKVMADDRIVIDAVSVSNPQALKGQLEALGAEVTGVAGKIVSARLAVDQVSALPELPELLFARPALAFTRTGSVTSQGDQAINADIARTTFSVDGTGSTVGVLSDSYDCLGGAAADVSSLDLPPSVNVIKEYSNCRNGWDEGRAMAQIVHDVAPGAKIQFRTAFEGEADFAQGIIDLKNAGSRVIVDDVVYLEEPFFQDGVIAQAVDTVVAGGVSYFSAAGNDARQSYYDDFRPGQVYADGVFPGGFFGGTAHDFDPGAGVDAFQKITCHAGDELVISLQWDNPYPSLGGPPPAADVDVYLLDNPPTRVLARSTDRQSSGAPLDPVEIFGVNCNSTVSANLMIVKYSGTPSSLSKIKYVDFGGGVSIDEYDTQSATSVGHPNAAGAIATGASAYFLTNPPVLNYYSSAGGVPILFKPDGTPIPGGILRAKPELTSVDGGDNTFFGGDYEPNGMPNFFGTSAAAPHAAAVAALMLEANNSLTPTAIKTAMQATAVDILNKTVGSFDGDLVPIGVGFDNDSGAGLLDAEAAVAAVVGGRLPQSPCDINVAPQALSFGKVAVGNKAKQKAIKKAIISNTGTRPCTVTGLTKSGSADFTLGAGAPIPPFSVNAGSPVTVPVKYKPSGAGADTGILTVSSNDTDEAIVLSGNGVAPLTCDVDADGDIDKNDLALIWRARGHTIAAKDPRDTNGDGKITSADVKTCIQLYMGAKLKK